MKGSGGWPTGQTNLGTGTSVIVRCTSFVDEMHDQELCVAQNHKEKSIDKPNAKNVDRILSAMRLLGYPIRQKLRPKT